MYISVQEYTGGTEGLERICEYHTSDYCLRAISIKGCTWFIHSSMYIHWIFPVCDLCCPDRFLLSTWCVLGPLATAIQCHLLFSLHHGPEVDMLLKSVCKTYMMIMDSWISIFLKSKNGSVIETLTYLPLNR